MNLSFYFTGKVHARRRVRVSPDGIAYVTGPSHNVRAVQEKLAATGVSVNRVVWMVTERPPLIHNGKKRRK